jgi:hypothetical protein
MCRVCCRSMLNKVKYYRTCNFITNKNKNKIKYILHPLRSQKKKMKRDKDILQVIVCYPAKTIFQSTQKTKTKADLCSFDTTT